MATKFWTSSAGNICWPADVQLQQKDTFEVVTTYAFPPKTIKCPVLWTFMSDHDELPWTFLWVPNKNLHNTWTKILLRLSHVFPRCSCEFSHNVHSTFTTTSQNVHMNIPMTLGSRSSIMTLGSRSSRMTLGSRSGEHLGKISFYYCRWVRPLKKIISTCIFTCSCISAKLIGLTCEG
jgi:hypothetical protein